MRAMPAADAVTCSARLRIAAVSIEAPCALPFTPLDRRDGEAMSLSPISGRDKRLGKLEQVRRFRTRMRRSLTDAMPSTYRLLRPARESCGGVMAASGSRRNSRPSSTISPTLRPLALHDDEPRAHVVGRTLEAEPRSQVDRRHDLSARKDDAVDERRRVRHPRDLFDHLHVLHLMAAQAHTRFPRRSRR